MQDTEFSTLAEDAIATIADIIEAKDNDGFIDIDFQGDILNITTKHGIFVINKHSAAKEIWLSSPISGPHHFAYVEGKWKSKALVDLMELLANELQVNFA